MDVEVSIQKRTQIQWWMYLPLFCIRFICNSNTHLQQNSQCTRAQKHKTLAALCGSPAWLASWPDLPCKSDNLQARSALRSCFFRSFAAFARCSSAALLSRCSASTLSRIAAKRSELAAAFSFQECVYCIRLSNIESNSLVSTLSQIRWYQLSHTGPPSTSV